MNDGKNDLPEIASQPVRPPPLPINAETLMAASRPVPPMVKPTTWKKILWIVGLCLLGGLGITILVGALLFGGCMWLVNKAGH
jgi:hypothetical protein